MDLLIGYTGLRRDELNKLPFSAFDLEGPAPVLNLPAELTKNKKAATIPLRPELVQALRDFWPELAMPYEFVFRGKVPSPAKLREDLAKIGVPYQDERGRRLDVHALRKTFITMGAASGMAPQLLKILARHSELRLTLGAYTDNEKMPLAAAIAGLPSISMPEKRTQNHTQTGAISGHLGAFHVTPCHFLASAQHSVSVSFEPTKAPGFMSCHSPEMVGVARFEMSGADLKAVENQKLNESATMSNIHNSNLAPDVDSLRKQLTEADSKRRELLAALFIQHSQDCTPIVKLLFAEASFETLARVEAMLCKEEAS
jgi:hypothetical protein